MSEIQSWMKIAQIKMLYKFETINNDGLDILSNIPNL